MEVIINMETKFFIASLSFHCLKSHFWLICVLANRME